MRISYNQFYYLKIRFSGIRYFKLNLLFQIINESHLTNSRRRDMAEMLLIPRKTLSNQSIKF